MNAPRVLIADDEATEAAAIEDQLLSLGYSIAGHAISGEQAARMAGDCRPDIVLMDTGLDGGTDGIAAAAHIQKACGLPVIFLIANENDAALHRAINVNPAGYLFAPVRERELRVAIEAGMRRHAADQKLRETEDKYSALFESANDAILIIEGSTFIDCNRRALTVFGCSREELIGKSPFDFSPPFQGEGLPSRNDGIARVNSALQGNTEIFDWVHCRRDGTRFLAEVTLTRLHIQGRPCLQAIVRDIDNRKRAEEAIQRERILLRTLIDNLPDAIYVKDRDSRKTVANLADVRNMGLRSESEALGRTDFDLFPEEIARSFHADDQSVIQNGIPIVNKDELVVDRHGQNRWLRTTKLPLRNKGSEIIGVVGVSRDITDVKEAEASLRLFRTLIDHSTDAIEVIDPDTGRLLDGNERAWSDLGYTREEFLSLSIQDIALNIDRRGFKSTGNEVRGAESLVFESTHRRKDGSTFPVEIHMNYVQLNRGYIVAVAHDITKRRSAEEVIRDSEERFRMVFDHVFDGISIYSEDPDPARRRLIECNDRYAAMSGRSRDQLLEIGSTIGLQRPLDDATNDKRVESLSRGTAYHGSFSWIRPDGQDNAVEYVAMPITWQGQSYSIGIDRDITERTKAERQLLESERRLSEIVQSFPEATLVIDREGVVVAWNRAMEELSGVTADKMLGKGNYEYALPFYGERRRILVDAVMRDSKDIESMYPDCVRQGDSVTTEILLTTQAGEQLCMFSTATALRNSDGEITGGIESMRDITSSRAAERALRESEERFRLISDNIADLITVVDRAGICLYASASHRREGIDPARIVGSSFLDYIHPDDATEVRRGMAKVFTEQTHQSLGFRLRNKEGGWQFKEAAVSLLSSEADGKLVAVIRDVTDRMKQEEERFSLQKQLRQRNLELERTLEDMKQMQAGLVQSEKLASIGQLTAGIAHEINNPLAFVSSNLNRFQEYFDEVLTIVHRWSSLREELSRDPRYTGRAREMEEAEERADLKFVIEDFSRLMKHTTDGTERIRSIVERLRGFTHLSDSGFAYADINAAIEDTLNLTWNELKYKATVEKDYGEIPKVVCNIGEIKQVLVNLLVNAAHAIPENGTITVRTRLGDARVIIQVEDTGSGIPRVHLKRIFDPFFTTKPVGKGTGLGLWISATIIQKHNGTISANSEPGHGTTMTVELPLHQEPVQEDVG